MEQDSPFLVKLEACARSLADAECQSLGPLFDLTSQRLVRYAVTITRNQHDAEDVVQQVLLRVAGHPEQVCQARSPWSYLLRMVRNEAISLSRRSKRVVHCGELIDLVTYVSVDQAEIEETHRAVWSSLRRLPAEQAEVVALKIWEELTFAQIGEVLEVSPHTAASRYKYAMRRLSQMLMPKSREMMP